MTGPVLHLDHQHIDWFGHVLLDLLAPAWAFDFVRAYLGLPGLRVLCSRPRHGFVERMLAARTGAKRLLLIDAPVRCAELIVATKAIQIQEYTTPAAARLFRAMSVRVAGAEPAQGERIFVSRADNPTRPLHEQILVERIFVAHGFRIFHPERHDVDEQIRVFAVAELIAGCSGSNMFGIAVARRARAVLVSPLLFHWSEQLLSAEQGFELTMVMGFTVPDEIARDPGNVHARWHVAPEMLAPAVTAWVARHAR